MLRVDKIVKNKERASCILPYCLAERVQEIEKEDGYELISEQSTKPMGEALENLILKASSNNPDDSSNPANKAKKSGLFATMGRFLKALQQ